MKLLKIEEICFSPSFGRMRCAVLAAPFELGASIYSADKNKEAAEAQNEAQLEANRKQIEAQKEQNDLAFQRNNSLGQLSQLMQAGLSEQQARQVIAGAGATGTYEPAPIANEMQGVDLGAPIRAEGEKGAAGLHFAGTMAQEAGRLALGAFGAPNGGELGAALAAPLMEDFTKNLSLVDRDKVHNFTDLEVWAKGLDPNSQAGKVFHSMLDSKAFKRVQSFTPATKAFNSYVNDIYTSNLSSKQQFDRGQQDIALSIAEQSLKNAETYLTQRSAQKIDAETGLITQQYKTEIERTKQVQQEVLGTHYDVLMKKLGYNREVELYDVITDAQKQQYLAQAQNALNQYRLQSDPQYVENWLKAQNANVQGQYFLSLLNACRDRAKYLAMSQDPQLQYVTSIYDALTQSGMNTGVLGQILQGSGFTTFELDSRLENVPESFTNMPPLN